MSVVALRASALNKCIMMNLMCPVVANEDTNVADTLLLMMFPEWANERDTKHLFCVHAAQTGKHLLRTQNVSDKNQNIFCVSDTKFVSATNVARTGKRGNICVRSNVSATLCPRLPPPFQTFKKVKMAYQYQGWKRSHLTFRDI